MWKQYHRKLSLSRTVMAKSAKREKKRKKGRNKAREKGFAGAATYQPRDRG